MTQKAPASMCCSLISQRRALFERSLIRLVKRFPQALNYRVSEYISSLRLMSRRIRMPSTDEVKHRMA